MKLKISFSISLRRESDDKSVDDDFEHRDTDSVAEIAMPQRVGFDIPTTGDDRGK